MNLPSSAHSPLPAGYTLDSYRFENVLGNPGGFGITYAARILRTDERVAIKELFPFQIAMRDEKRRVVPQNNANGQCFGDLKRMFRREAETLLAVKHENVVRVRDYLEANGTAYMVMGYEEGCDLAAHLRRQRPNRLNENELRRLLMPLLDGLQAVHNVKYLHRDIKPSNIYLTRDHKPVLLDFGSARANMGRTMRVTQFISEGFSPVELYLDESRQGPFTDIYSMGVVVWSAMLPGEVFQSAFDRARHDGFVPLVKRLRGQEYSEAFLKAVDWAVKLRAEERPQSIDAWRRAFGSESVLASVSAPPRSQSRPLLNTGTLSSLRKLFSRRLPPPHSPANGMLWRILAVFLAVVAGTIVLTIILRAFLNG